jgi:hypothetical protein
MGHRIAHSLRVGALFGAAAVIASAWLGSGADVHAAGLGACNAPYAPNIDPAAFTGAKGQANVIDNPYLPLLRGRTLVYTGLKEGEAQTDTVAVTNLKKTIMGLPITVVHEQVTAAGVVREDTFDFYAQDDSGNVWYFGEDTREFDAQGNLVTTEGSWEAGINGAFPGIIMEAQPESGDAYRQEYAPGVAVDMGSVLSLQKQVTVPYGTFDNVLETKEYSCIESGVDHKFYAAGIGDIQEIAVAGGGETLELVSVETKGG